MKKEFSQIIQKEFGKKVKSYRLERDLSQLDLAIKTDSDIRQIQRVENGEVATSVTFAYQIAKALNVTMNDLFEFEV